MDFPKGLKGARLIRYSSVKQSDERQRIQLSTYDTLKKLDWEVIETFEEDEISATLYRWNERPQLVSLVEGILRGKFGFLEASDWDRIARDINDGLFLSKIFKQAGIFLVEASTGKILDMRTENATAAFLRNILPHIEILTLRTRVLPPMEENIRQGLSNGGTPPFGFRFNNRTYDINPIEAVYVDEVLKYSLQGLGPTAIAQLMPEGSYRGENWTKRHVEKILDNPIYIGQLTWKKRKNRRNSSWKPSDNWMFSKAEWIPKIVRQQLWDQVQEVQETQKDCAPRDYTSPFLLRNYIRCGECDTIMTPRNGQSSYPSKKTGDMKKYGKRYYECKKCGRKLEKDQLESEVLKHIRLSLDLDQRGLKELFERSILLNINECEKYLVLLREEIMKLEGIVSHHYNELQNLDDELKDLVTEQVFSIKDEINNMKESIKKLEKNLAKYNKLKHKLNFNFNLLRTLLNNCNGWAPNEIKLILSDLLVEVVVIGDSGKIILKERVDFFNEKSLCF